MKKFDCDEYVMWGLVVGLFAWVVFIATLIYATYFVADVPAQLNNLYTQRRGMQAAGFMVGWWIAIAGLALCVVGYFREFKAPNCLLGVIPAALYVANPWSVMVFVKFTGG